MSPPPPPSAPSPHPLLASLLPVKPDSELLLWNGKTSVGLSAQDIEAILARARSGDFWLSHFDIPERTPQRTLALAIDPETGDSVLHIAATFTGEPLRVEEVIRQTDVKTCGQDRSLAARLGTIETVLVHQNNAGDSCLHVAARGGWQKAVTYLYRAFCFHESRDYPDVTDSPARERNSYLAEFDEHDDWTVDHECAKRLAFLLLPNSARQTAADVARSAGHVKVAAWLENIATLLNPGGHFTAQNIPQVIEEAQWKFDDQDTK